MYEISSVIHVHSKYSDGSGEIPEIARYASEVGVNVVLMTDHNTLRPLKDGLEGWYDHTLVLIGTEINDQKNENHYLAFGITNTFDNRLSAQEYVKRINDEGGFGFIAHPFEKRNHMERHPPYPWTAWDSEYFTGIEVWNHMSEWMEGLTEQNKYQRFIHPLKSVSAPDANALKIWDQIALKRKIVGIGGVDAHAHKQNVLGFFEVEIFPYKVLFKSVRTVVLCPQELNKDTSPESIKLNKEMIYSSLKDGRCYIGNFYHADTKGFKFFAEAGNKIYQMGEDIPNSVKNARFRVNLPHVIGEMKFVKNGEVIDTTFGSEGIWEIVNYGVYRVEVYLDGNAWIFSNHIRFGLGS